MSLSLLLPALVGYLLGSIPSGLLLTRVAGLGDIRAIGSGNIGATNVLRTGSKALAAATLAIDVLKGAIAVWIAPELAFAASSLFGNGPTTFTSPGGIREAILAASFAGAYGAILGHLYPVWLGFLGGKGVATFIGVLLGLFWPAGLVFCAAWLLTALAFRISSLSALVAAIVTPVALAVMGRVDLAIPITPLVCLLIFKHRENISRLLAGEEPRIGQKS